MTNNVIILTNGLSGSSVLTGLIAKGGYWTGQSTFKKSDYDTFENQELVDLNLRLLHESGYTGNYAMEYSREGIDRIAALSGVLDPAPYLAFIEKCQTHMPWIWKDPRLWLTIRYWGHILPLSQIRFVVLTRDVFQTWVSTTLRRQIQEFSYLRRYMDGITGSVVEFLNSRSIPYLALQYEQLILQPDRAIEKLNEFIGTKLTVADLQQVYTKPLYRNPRSVFDYPKAVMVYLKNYRQRYR